MARETMEFFADALVRIICAPFAGALALAVMIRIAGSSGSGRRIASAGIGLAFAWSAAMIFGAPEIPPAPGPDGLVSVAAVGLILGTLFDIYGQRDSTRSARVSSGITGWLADWRGWLEWTLILAFGGGTAAWMQEEIGSTGPVITGLWGLAVLRLRHVFGKNNDTLAGDALVPLAMLMMAAAGLALTAAAANSASDRDLALALAAAIAGFLALSLFDRSLGFGLTPVLGAAGSVLAVAVRIADADRYLIPAVAVLGFIFYADTLFRQPALARCAGLRWGRLGLVVLGALVPIALAATAALVGVGFTRN
ncbi:MAG: hypothetical protein VYE18_03780 [Pseudomonadota bacterium]|nr:hypothetical protein [Pseudomonadota bacterium]